MRRRVAVWIAAACALCACDGSPRINLPSAEGMRSAVILIETFDGEAPRAFATPTDEPLRTQLPETGRITMMAYRQTLDDLRLPPGEIARVDDEPSRGLPASDAIHVAEIDDDGTQAFTRTATVSRAVLAFRLRELSFEECRLGNGCFAGERRDVLGRRTCILPCRTPPAPQPPAPPIAPEAPRFTPCREGWSESTQSDGLTVCHLPASSFGQTCPPGFAKFLDDPSCRRLGADCPGGATMFAADAPAQARFVLVGATPGGDGSRTQPFATIAEALASAGDGDTPTTILLSRGSHVGNVRLTGNVDLRGTCVEETTIVGVGNDQTILSVAGNTRLEGVRIESSTLAIDVHDGSRLEIRDVEISRAWHGIVVEGALDAERIVIATSSRSGVRLLAADRGSRLHDVVIGAVGRQGILVRSTTPVVEISNVTFLRSRTTTPQLVVEHSTAVVEGVFAEAPAVGFARVHSGSVSVDRFVIRSATSDDAVLPTFDVGQLTTPPFLALRDGAILDEPNPLRASTGTVTLERVRIEGCEACIMAERNTRLRWRDVLLAQRGTAAATTAAARIGDGATLDGVRSFQTANGTAIALAHDGVARLLDLEVRGSLDVVGVLELERATVRAMTLSPFGPLYVRAGADAMLTDVRIGEPIDPIIDPDAEQAPSLNAQGRTHVTRLSITGATEVGLHTAGDAQVTIEDLTVDDGPHNAMSINERSRLDLLRADISSRIVMRLNNRGTFHASELRSLPARNEFARVHLDGEGQLFITRFDIAGGGTDGVSVSGVSIPSLRDGVLRDCDEAIDLRGSAPGLDPRELMDFVWIVDSARGVSTE